SPGQLMTLLPGQVLKRQSDESVQSSRQPPPPWHLTLLHASAPVQSTVQALPFLQLTLQVSTPAQSMVHAGSLDSHEALQVPPTSAQSSWQLQSPLDPSHDRLQPGPEHTLLHEAALWS